MLFDRQSRRIFPALMVVASVTIVAGCQSTMLQPVATAAKSKHLDAAKSGPAIPDASKDLGRSSERTQFPPVSGLAESSPAISPADNAIGVTGDLSTLPRTDNPDPLVVKDATTAQVARNVLITEDPEFRSPPANTPGSATPLLDAAIRRAEQEEREMAMALTAPEPEKLEPSPRPTVAKIPVASPSEKPNPESKPILPMDSVPVASAGPVALNPIEAPESEKPKPGQAELRVPPTAPEPSRTTRDLTALETPPKVTPKVDPTVKKASLKDDGPRGEEDSLLSKLNNLLVPEVGDSAFEHSGKSLEISDARLCRKVLSFGSVEPLKSPALKPGQLVVLYAELVGIDYEKKGQEFQSVTSSKLELFKAGDKERKPVWSDTPADVKDLCKHRRRDFYLNYLIPVPTEITPGDYVLRLSVTDLVSKLSATSEVALTVSR